MRIPPHRNFPQHLIARKRDGETLTPGEIADFVNGATFGTWADYQLSAMLMAIYLRGMDAAETAALTEAMMRSGQIADLSSVRRAKVDKHSTGGVGDKISLPLAPLVAACGIAVPMISGRGLGHTGGTLDKLESIPGFKVELDLETYRAQVERIGLALIGQTDQLAPADRKLYALRDVTATVECLPLICASILSKKLAEGIEALVLDVKFGRGAFMKTRDQARELASTMVAVARRLGKPTRALLTRMEEPLGRTVGNALEVKETLACLRGEGPQDVMELTYALGVEMLLLGGGASNEAEARAKLEAKLADGSALERFRLLIEAQGGEARCVEHPELLPQARYQLCVPAPREAWVQEVDAMEIALAALRLGAGRVRAEDKVDPAAGLSGLAQRGEKVFKGQALALLHTNDESLALAVKDQVLRAFVLGEEPPTPRDLVAERLV